MRMIHWWLVEGHWFSAVAYAGETAKICLLRNLVNQTAVICSTPSGWAPFEWECALRCYAEHKPHLSKPI